jgi:intraflagellar transport protein 80
MWGQMTESCIWHEDVNILAACSDGKFLVWYAPEARSFDGDLMALTCTSSDASNFGKMPRLHSLEGSAASIRREDGALIMANILPYPIALKKYAAKLQWDRCSKLCRLVNDATLWAVFAVCALQAQELDHAEVALAAIDQVEKLEYVPGSCATLSFHLRSAISGTLRSPP